MRHRLGHGAAGPALLRQRHEHGTGARQHAHGRIAPADLGLIGAAVDRAFGRDHRDVLRLRSLDRRLRARLDDADDRQIRVSRAQRPEGGGGCRVAGHDQRADPAPEQCLGALQGIARHGIGTLGAVGQPGRIAEIDEVLRRQRVGQRAQHGETAHARVEHADGRIAPDRCGQRHRTRRPARAFYSSGRMCGNKSTSRIDGAFANSITTRSTPSPNPAVGGMPYSSART